MRILISFIAIIIVLIAIAFQMGTISQENWAGFGLANLIGNKNHILPQETSQGENENTPYIEPYPGPTEKKESEEEPGKKESESEEMKQTGQTEEVEEITQSPYIGKIEINRVKIQTSSNPSLITLKSYLDENEVINITGWKLKTKNNIFTIPPGIEMYYPLYNSEPSDPISVKKGDKIYLSGAQSPFGRDMNFRTNKCSGYFYNYRDFPIDIDKNCPLPSDEEINYLQPCCKVFIDDLKKCETPDYSDDIKIYSDYECTNYINNYFNYNSCFYKFYKDDDFLENEWHIYTNKNITAINDCDVLYLIDGNGLIVDSYSYGKAVCK